MATRRHAMKQVLIFIAELIAFTAVVVVLGGICFYVLPALIHIQN